MKKEVKIDYLFLDLQTCERCIGTDQVLEEALSIIQPILKLIGYHITYRKIEIQSAGLAEKHRFLASPTVRVNEVDIDASVAETDCDCCSSISGTDVTCRVFKYEGQTYEIPPVEALTEAILKAIFAPAAKREEGPYVLPQNLKTFFAGKTNRKERKKIMKSMAIYEPAMCCATGLCGVGVDPELLRISTVLNNLNSKGAEIARYNLSNVPQAFVDNQEINQLLEKDGVDSLPATVVDGKIVKTQTYPSNEEIAEMLDIPVGFVEAEEKETENAGCGCSGGCC